LRVRRQRRLEPRNSAVYLVEPSVHAAGRCAGRISLAAANSHGVIKHTSREVERDCSESARARLYVDVTRAGEHVTIACGEDEVQNFRELLVRAQRDNGKVLVRDVQRGVTLRAKSWNRSACAE